MMSLDSLWVKSVKKLKHNNNKRASYNNTNIGTCPNLIFYYEKTCLNLSGTIFY